MDGMDFQSGFGEPLCRVCQKRYVARSLERPDEYLCKECRAELTKLRVPKWMIAMICATVILALVMSVYTVTAYRNNRVSKQTVDSGNEIISLAEELFENKQQYTALVTIDDYMLDNPQNVDVAYVGVRMAMASGYYDYAAYLFTEYMEDAGFTEEELEEINSYVDRLNYYYDTSDAIDTVFNSLDVDWESLSDEEAQKAIEDYKNQLLKLVGNAKFDDEMIYYTCAYLASSEEEVLSYLEKVMDYVPVAANAAAMMARFERQNGNFDKAYEWIEKGEEISAELPELIRSKVTILLAEGNYEDALPIAKKLYEDYPDADYVVDTYCVALFANGLREDFSVTMLNAEANGYVFDEAFRDLKDGKISVRDYYVTGEGL